MLSYEDFSSWILRSLEDVGVGGETGPSKKIHGSVSEPPCILPLYGMPPPNGGMPPPKVERLPPPFFPPHVACDGKEKCTLVSWTVAFMAAEEEDDYAIYPYNKL